MPSRIIFFAVEQHPFQDNIRYATILDQRFYSLVREYGALNFRKPPDLTKLLASWSTTGDEGSPSRCSLLRGNLCNRFRRLQTIMLPRRPPQYQCSEGASLHALPGLSTTLSPRTKFGPPCRG